MSLLLPPQHNVEMTPLRVTMSRLPPSHLNQDFENTDTNGTIISSDQAYIDTILDVSNPTVLDSSNSYSPNVYLTSCLFKEKQKSSLSTRSVRYCHTLFYKGEPVWQLETSDHCNGREVWGLSSYCHVTSNGHLRVRVNHKGRKAVGQGWNAWETREFCVREIILKSGLTRQNDLIAEDTAMLLDSRESLLF